MIPYGTQQPADNTNSRNGAINSDPNAFLAPTGTRQGPPGTQGAVSDPNSFAAARQGPPGTQAFRMDAGTAPPVDIAGIASGVGGGFQLAAMVNGGQLTLDQVRAAMGDEATDAWLTRNPNIVNSANTPAGTTPTGAAPAGTANPNADPNYNGNQTPSLTYNPTLGQTSGTLGGPGMTGANAGNTTQNTGNAGGYINPSVPGGTTANTDYSRYPTPIPTSPNYEAAANQQGQANLDAARGTIALSNPNQNTPYGSQTYTIGPDGRPVQTQSLSPELQQRFSDLNSILPSLTNTIRNNASQGLNTNGLQSIMNLDNIDLPDVMDLNNISLPERQTQTGVQGQSAVAEALRAREQPRLDRKRQQLEAQLLTRGFNPGTEGWNEAVDDFSRSENDFNLGLTALSGQEQSRLFNLDTENRNTRRAELNDLFGAQSQNRAARVNELSTLFGAQSANRANQLNERLLSSTLPIQQYQQLIQAMQPQLPQFNQYTGATVEANPIFNATAQKGLFDLGRYGTSIQGELGTRGIDSQNDWGRTIAQGIFDVGGAALM